jgi:hypothetical protein
MSVGDHRLGVSMVSVAHLVVSVVLLVGALRLQSRFFIVVVLILLALDVWRLVGERRASVRRAESPAGGGR